MLTVIGLADIHNQVSMIEAIADKLAEVDLVLLLGDITHFGSEKDAERVLYRVSLCNPNILTVPGNCDPAGVWDYLDSSGLSLDRQHRIINGIAFVGLGGSLPCPGLTPMERSEEQYHTYAEEVFTRIPEGLPIMLVTHQPPFNTGADLAANGTHVGSTSIRSAIEQHHPVLCFCGHIHEAVGVSEIDGCQVLNPGPLRDGRYAWAKIREDAIVECGIRNA